MEANYYIYIYIYIICLESGVGEIQNYWVTNLKKVKSPIGNIHRMNRVGENSKILKQPS